MTTTARNNFGVGCNPIIKKMYDKADTAATAEVASYRGVARKTAFFLLMAVAGFAAFFALHLFLAGMGNPDIVYNVDDIFHLNMFVTEAAVAGTALVVSVLAPLFAWFFRSAIPVVGTFYALCEGYTIGFLTGMLAPQYQWISAAALVITILVVSAMLFLYAKRIVKVGQKFRTVVTTVFITMILGGLLTTVLYMIPFTRALIAPVLTFMGNPLISIGLSVVYLIVACLFLLVDFSVIEECIERGISRKFEWMAAFGLAYTIIYIYFRVLELILKIVAMTKKS